MADTIHKLSFDFSEYKSSNTVFIDASSNQDALEVSFYNNGIPFDLTKYTPTLFLEKTDKGAYQINGNTATFRINRTDGILTKEWTVCEIQLVSWATGNKVVYATQNFLIYQESYETNIDYDKNGNYLTKADIDRVKNFQSLHLSEMIDPMLFPDGTVVQYVGDDVSYVDGIGQTNWYYKGYFYQASHLTGMWRRIDVQPVVKLDGSEVNLTNHNNLSSRNEPNQHPMASITNLIGTVGSLANDKIETTEIDALFNEIETEISEVSE